MEYVLQVKGASRVLWIWLIALPLGCAKTPPAAELVEAVDAPAADVGQSQDTTFCCVTGKRQKLDELSTQEWVAQLRAGNDFTVSEAGEEAVPILMAALKDPRAALRVLLILQFAASREDWMIPVCVAALHNPDTNIRFSAIHLLGEFGPSVRRVVPTIAEDLRAVCSDELGDQILQLLAKIELPAQEALSVLKALYAVGSNSFRGPSYGNLTQEAVLRTIMRYGPEATSTLLDLAAEMDSVRGFPGTRLSWGPDWITSITAGLNDDKPERRRAAAWLLTQIDHRQINPEQLAALITHLADEDGFVREYLLEILDHTPPHGPDTVPALVACLADEHGSNPFRAAGILAKMAPDSLPALHAAAVSENARVRLAATSGLGSLQPIEAAELSLLLSLVRDQQPDIRQYAVYGLQQSKSLRADVLEALSAALEDAATADWATRALGELGPAATAAVPRMVDKLTAAEPLFRLCLARAIWQIEHRAPAVLPAILDTLKDTKTPRGGYTVVETKMVAGKRIEVTGPMQSPIACSAAEILGEMGADAAPAVPALLEAAQSDHRALASSAIHALGKIGPPSREAVPMLSKLAASQDSLADSAHRALREIDPAVAESIRQTDVGFTTTFSSGIAKPFTRMSSSQHMQIPGPTIKSSPTQPVAPQP